MVNNSFHITRLFSIRIAKKAVVFGKRSGFNFAKMAIEVAARITKATKDSDEMSTAIENLNNHTVEDVKTTDKNSFTNEVSKPEIENMPTPEDEFSVKSLNW